MKILCPIDFSIASIDAVRYAMAMIANEPGSTIDLLHCVFHGQRDSIFTDKVDFWENRATEHVITLINKIELLNPSVKLSHSILHGDPLDLVPEVIEHNNYDYTVIGTKGLRAEKDIIIGSLTEQLFEESQDPILAVPQGYVFQSLDSVVLSIDDDAVSSAKVIEPLVTLLNKYSSKLKLLHVSREEDDHFEYDPDLDVYLKGIDFEFYSRHPKTSVNKAINDVCQHVEADLLCMIHRDRGWMLNVFHRSQVKEELLRLSIPILILHD